MFTTAAFFTGLLLGTLFTYLIMQVRPFMYQNDHIYYNLEQGDTIQTRHFGQCVVLKRPTDLTHLHVKSIAYQDELAIDVSEIMFKISSVNPA